MEDVDSIDLIIIQAHSLIHPLYLFISSYLIYTPFELRG